MIPSSKITFMAILTIRSKISRSISFIYKKLRVRKYFSTLTALFCICRINSSKVMHTSMFIPGDYLKVIYGVIEPILIFMMNRFILFKLSAKNLFHNISVFKYSFTIDGYNFVPICYTSRTFLSYFNSIIITPFIKSLNMESAQPMSLVANPIASIGNTFDRYFIHNIIVSKYRYRVNSNNLTIQCLSIFNKEKGEII